MHRMMDQSLVSKLPRVFVAVKNNLMSIMRCIQVQLLFPYAPRFLQQSPYTQLVHTLWLMSLQDSLASVDRSQVTQAYGSRNVEGYHIRSNETISWEKPTNLSYKLTIWKWVLQAEIMSNLKGRAKRGKRLWPLRGKHILVIKWLFVTL